MADQSWISNLIEALRGGNNPAGPPANRYYSSSNPPPHVNRDPGMGGLSEGLRDPQYAAYVKKSGGMAKPYMKWIEEGE